MKAYLLVSAMLVIALSVVLLGSIRVSADVDVHEMWASNSTEENQNELGNCTEGDLVWFNATTYALTAALTLNTNLTINGSQGTIIAGTTFGCFAANASVNITIRDINMTVTTGSALTMASAEGNASITNVNITATTGKGMNMAAAGNVTSTNMNYSSTTGNAIHKTGEGNITISGMNCTSTGVGGSAVSLSANGNITVQNLKFSGFGGAGISYSKEGNVSVSSSNFTTSFGSSAYGIYQSGTTYSSEVVISFCNFSTAASRNVLVKGFGNLTASNCTLNVTTTYALSHTGTGNITVIDCNSNATSGSAIAHFGTGNISATRCNITTTTGMGIGQSQAGLGNVTAEMVTFYSPLQGPGVSLSGLGNISLSQCNFRSTAGQAISMGGQGNVTATNCILTGALGSADVQPTVGEGGAVNITFTNVTGGDIIGTFNGNISLVECSLDAALFAVFSSGFQNVSIVNSTISSSGVGLSIENGSLSFDNVSLTCAGLAIVQNGTGQMTLNNTQIESNGVTHTIMRTGTGNISITNTSIISTRYAIATSGEQSLALDNVTIAASWDAINYASAGTISINASNISSNVYGIYIGLGSAFDLIINNSILSGSIRAAYITDFGYAGAANISNSQVSGPVYVYYTGDLNIYKSTLSTSVGTTISHGTGLLNITLSTVSSSGDCIDQSYSATSIVDSNVTCVGVSGRGFISSTNSDLSLNNCSVYGPSGAVSTGGVVTLTSCYNESATRISRLNSGSISYSAGMALFCLPSNNTQYANASDIAALDGVFYIAVYNSSGWVKYYKGGIGASQDFPLIFGRGYFVFLTRDIEISFDNYLTNFSANYSTNESGTYMISNPTSAAVHASVLISNSSNVFYLALWNPTFTGFTKYYATGPGTDFEIPALGVVWAIFTDEDDVIVYDGA